MSDTLHTSPPPNAEKPTTASPTLTLPSQPPPAPDEDDKPHSYQWLREGVAAVISLGILLITLLMLYNTFFQASLVSQAGTPAEVAYNHMKDIMLYGLALLGTVTGYYFGRVPAELHAQQAQRTADIAQKDSKQTSDDARATSSELNQTIARSQESERSKTERLNKTQEKLDAAHDKQKQITRGLLNVRDLLHQASPPSNGANIAYSRSNDTDDANSSPPTRTDAATGTPVRQAQEEINALLEHLNS